MDPLITWVIFAALQVPVIVAGMVVLVRRPHHPRQSAAVLVGAAAVIALADVAWIATGGMAGESPIPMRGGVLGFVLSLVTAAEIAVLGALLLVRWR